MAYAVELEHLLDQAAMPEKTSRVTFDAAGVDALDTLGAWLIGRAIRDQRKLGRETSLVGLPDRYRHLFDEIAEAGRDPVAAESPTRPPSMNPFASVAGLGRSVAEAGSGLLAIVAMLGAVGHASLAVLRRPHSFRLTSTIHHLDRVGWRALPIIFLITLLIGGIIAQQGIFHFRRFGAESYVVDLVGILILREIGVLIVAIMVAGRSGSAYTAELGSMTMREEIDALRAMALDPVEVLMLPRIVALVIALPILAFFGSLSALLGGGLVCWIYGDMNPAVYVERLKEAVTLAHFQVGMIKAPFMALVIGIVACSEGMQVRGSAESLGLQTTASVVKSIFLVIVLDGLFAVFFASIGM